MRPVYNLIAPVTDPNGIAVAQQSTIPIDLLLNGVLFDAIKGVASLNNVAQVVQLTSAGNLAAVNFTITGRNDDGRIISETIAGPNAGTVVTTDAAGALFTTVTKISSDGAITADVEAGVAITDFFTSTPIMLDTRPAGKSARGTQTVEISAGATMTYTVQFTSSNLQDPTVTPVWINTDDVNLIAQTGTKTGNFSFPMVATRLFVTGFAGGTANFINIQDG